MLYEILGLKLSFFVIFLIFWKKDHPLENGDLEGLKKVQIFQGKISKIMGANYVFVIKKWPSAKYIF